VPPGTSRGRSVSTLWGMTTEATARPANRCDQLSPTLATTRRTERQLQRVRRLISPLYGALCSALTCGSCSSICRSVRGRSSSTESDSGAPRAPARYPTRGTERLRHTSFRGTIITKSVEEVGHGSARAQATTSPLTSHSGGGGLVGTAGSRYRNPWCRGGQF